MRAMTAIGMVLFLTCTAAFAGPYPETGIELDNPAIVGWATGYLDYAPALDVVPPFDDPAKALGPATGEVLDTVSLGEREAGSPDPPGAITLTFDAPIVDGAGPDLVVFENTFPSATGLFAELAYLEVSTDGEVFARFPCVSLTAEPIAQYGTMDPTDVYNLAGMLINAYGSGQGTPFDLADLAENSAVLSGDLDLADVNYVRVVDIPGAGDYFDSATALDYDQDHPIYDPHPTIGSAGFDLEAVGVVVGYTEKIGGDGNDDDDDANDDPAADDDDASGDDGEADDSGCGG